MKKDFNRIGATLCSSMRPRSATTSWLNKFKLLALVLTTMLSVNVWGETISLSDLSFDTPLFQEGFESCTVQQFTAKQNVTNFSNFGNCNYVYNNNTGNKYAIASNSNLGSTKVLSLTAGSNSPLIVGTTGQTFGTKGAFRIKVSTDSRCYFGLYGAIDANITSSSKNSVYLSYYRETAGKFEIFNSGTKNAVTGTFSAGNYNDICVIYNNTTTATTYGDNISLAAKTAHIYINGSAVMNGNSPQAYSIGGTSLTVFRVVPVASSGNKAIVDDIQIWDELPSAAGPSTYTVVSSLTNVTASPAIPETIEAGGTISTTISANSGYSLPDDITVSGGTKSWNKNTGALSITGVTGNVTVTIAATPKPYTLTVASVGDVEITAKAAGGSPIVEGGNANVDYNKTVTLNYSNLTDGKVLTWKVYKTGDESTTVSVSGTGNDATFTMPAYPVTVSATIGNAPTWTITLNSGSGTITGGETSIVVVQGQSTTLPSCEIECEDTYGEWEFAGWKTGSGVEAITTAAQTFVETNYTPGSDITLYAVYKAVDASGGSESKYSQTTYGTGSSDYWSGIGNYSNMAGKNVYFTIPENATQVTKIVITPDNNWGSGHNLAVDYDGTDKFTAYGTNNSNPTSYTTAFVVTSGKQIHFTGTGGGTIKVKNFRVEWTEKSSITRYWSIPCNEKYTMRFHGVIDWEEEGLDPDNYVELNATTITVYPTCTTAETGWTFLGWRTTDYNSGKTLDDESASTDDPDVNSIYKNGKGFALNSGTTSSCGDGVRCVDMYPVFTKFVENDKPEIATLASGSKYYMYYTSEDTRYQDDYSAIDHVTTRIYAHEFNSNAFNSTTLCESAQLFEFTKRADGNWDIRMRNAADDGYVNQSYIYTAENNTDLYTQAAQPSYGWVIEAVTIGGKTMVKMQYAGNTNPKRFMKVYDGGGTTASGTFKNYIDDCEGSIQYHAIYLGSCSNRIFSSNPGHAATWEVYGNFTGSFTHHLMTNGMLVVPNLAANTTYQFKLRKTTDGVHYTWFGDPNEHNNYNISGVEWTLNGESGGHNVNLVTGAAGSYTFTASHMSAEHPGITVTYPTAYTITFDGHGSDDGSMAAMTNLAMDEEINLTANEFSKTCNDFAGWNTNQDGTGTAYIDGGSVTVSGNMTLYAQWTPKRYDAIYDANGVTGYTGELPATVPYDCGDQVAIDQSKTLSKFGYTFIGWNTNPAATTPQPIETNPFTIDQGDTYIYAIWNAIKPTEIAITPETGGNSPVKGTGVQMLVTLTPDASTMAEENREVTWSSSNTTYATVNQSGYVNFVGQGTVTITATSKVDGSIVGNYIFSVQAGSCDGWIISAYDDGVGNVTNDYFRQVGSSDEWRVKYVLPNGTRKFWVGGSDCQYSSHSANWDFGWVRFKDRRDNSCGNNTQYPGQDAVGELVIWSNSTDANYGIAFLPNYKISYMTDGSNWRIMDFHSTSTQYSYETDIFQVPAGYKSNNDMEYFVGIEKNDGSNMFVDDGISSTDPMNRVNGLKEADMAGKYGKWHIWSNSCANNWYCEFNRYYQVRFEMNGGDGNIDPMYFYANNTESFNTNTLTNPTKTGYELTGWKDQEDHTYTTSESITVMKDLVLTAQWTARNYAITYNGLEDATNTNPGTYTIESAFDFVAPGERAGYTFVGWFDAATDGNPVTCIPLGSTGDVIVWAHWNAKNYTVTLYANYTDGTDGSAEFTYGTSTRTAYTPVSNKTGYTLSGYYTLAENGVKILDAAGNLNGANKSGWIDTDGNWIRTAADSKLYAHWSAITGIEYHVYHYQMNVDGETYTLKDHIDGTGKTGDDKSSYALPNNYEGFATPEAQMLIITWPGPCVVNYYYERNKYALTWDFDGETPAGDYTQGEVYYEAPITYPTSVSKDGFYFKGWDVTPPTTMPHNALTITAQWAAYENYRTYCGNAVTFVANGGTGDDYVVTVDAEKLTHIPTVKTAGFSREGYGFAGWMVDGDESKTVYAPDATINPITDGMIVNAVWISNPTINEAIPAITSTNNVAIASAPRTLTVANPDGLEATIHIAYKKNGEAVEKANSEFRFCKGGTISEGNITSTATSIATDFTIQYKPNAYNEIDTDYTLYITVTRKGSETVISSAEFNLKGRSLPEKFVIAVKNNSDEWLALPANMTSACSPEGMPITVTGEGFGMTADASLAATYSLTGHNTIVKDSVFFKSAYNNGELWASKSAYTIYDNTTAVSESNWNNYAWGLTPTDETLISYNVDNKNNGKGKNLRYYDNSKFGMYANGEGTIYFIAVTSREETTAVVDEWYQNKILFHLPFAMKSVSMTINGVAIDDADITIAKRKIKTTDYVLYELGGNINLVAHSGQIMELTISDGMTEYVANISIPQIIVGEVDGCSALPAKADVVVRDGGHLTIDVEGALAKSFNNVTIYPNSKISVPEGKYFNVKNLTFFGGIDEMNGTETNIYAPELSLKGTMKTDTIVYRMRVNATHMMPVSFPYDVIIDSIKREDQLGSTSWGKVGTDIRLETYDGESRAAGNRRKSDESTWEEIISTKESPILTAGIGYAVAAQNRFKNYLYTILDFPMANPYKSDAATEAVKNATVEAHEAVNWYDKGWNLMGNPYLASVTGAGAIKVGGTDYDFVYIPTADGEDYYQGPLATTHILPFMDFFVQVNDGGTMTFDLAKRVDAPKRMLAETERTAQFSISLTGANNTDIAYFKVADNYTESYDIPGDNAKMFGSAVNTKVYSLLNGEDQLAQMAINADLTAQPIQLGYIAPENGEYIFAMDDSYRERENVEHIYLLENGNAVADLLTANFKFESVSGTNDGRFSIVIVMKSHQVTTEMINTLMDKDTKNPQKFIYQDHFYIMDTQQRIYDGTGKYVNTLENEK